MPALLQRILVRGILVAGVLGLLSWFGGRFVEQVLFRPDATTTVDGAAAGSVTTVTIERSTESALAGAALFGLIGFCVLAVLELIAFARERARSQRPA